MIIMPEIDDAVQISPKGGETYSNAGNLINVFGYADNDKSVTNSRCIHASANHRLSENRRGSRPNADLMKL